LLSKQLLAKPTTSKFFNSLERIFFVMSDKISDKNKDTWQAMVKIQQVIQQNDFAQALNTLTDSSDCRKAAAGDKAESWLKSQGVNFPSGVDANLQFKKDDKSQWRLKVVTKVGKSNTIWMKYYNTRGFVSGNDD
jgi:hypothetical protein